MIYVIVMFHLLLYLFIYLFFLGSFCAEKNEKANDFPQYFPDFFLFFFNLEKNSLLSQLWPQRESSTYREVCRPSQSEPIDNCRFSFTVTMCHYHGAMSSIRAVAKRSVLVTHSFILIALISYSLNICCLVLPLTLKKQSLFECLTPFYFYAHFCLHCLALFTLPDNE